MNGDRFAGAFFATIVLGIIAGLIYGVFWAWPHYSVWRSEMVGRAAMARAEQDRQILVREAQAKRDAAKLLADAEIERARGVQEANRIIAEGLGGPEGYLRYLYIQQLGDSDKNSRVIVYVPTEAMLPITEAGRVQALPDKDLVQ